MKQLRRPPKYCQGFEDRHGKVRWYYRRQGFPRVALSGLPWSPEFMAAYELAANGEKVEIGKARSKAGTIGALIASYYRTADFTGLSDVTKRTYRNILERFRADHADKRVTMLQRQHVQRIISDKGDTPAAANRLLRMIRILMRHAVEMGWRKDDPTLGVRKVRETSKGFATWEEEHIDQFLATHKQGSRAHLAMSLLLHSGQRRSDVVRMGRQHIKNNVLTIVQQKTGQEVGIPMHYDLRALVDSLPMDNLTFIVGEQGKPLTPESFTNWFRRMVVAAGLPKGLSAHGLRKATCRRLAEAGCTPHQIMAISGHKTLTEVTRYTVAANRKQLAEQAVASLDGTITRTKVSNRTR
jgi:site-specific recombinase XerD